MVLIGSVSFAQVPPPDAGKDMVVVTIEGKPMTASQVEAFVGAMSPQVQQFYKQNPKEFLNQLALMMRFSEQAEKAGYPDKAPFRQRIEFSRMNVLMQALLEEKNRGAVIEPKDQEAYYEKNRDNYSTANVKVLYVSFIAGQSPTGQKAVTEVEAKAKIDGLRTRAMGGEDFVKLIKEFSEDKESKEKGGEFPPIRKSDQLPPEIKTAVFALKPNEISQPVRQPNGFYLFQLVKMEMQPYATVKDSIFQAIKDEKFKNWFEAERKEVKMVVNDESYFAPVPAPAPVPAVVVPPAVPPAKP